MAKPKLGVFGLTGCAGDQLVILNCEDQLLQITELVDIKDFLMASSGNDTSCELDVALVDGAVLSKRDEATLKKIRERSRLLVALGTCAVWGGVAAMDRGVDRARLVGEVYGGLGSGFDTLPARALHEVVKVDLNIPGCPVEKSQVVAAVASLLQGDPPLYPKYPVCTECRIRENNCLLIEQGKFCCGPLTVAGCGALCPSLNVPCVGCRGPAEDANVPSAMAMYREKGYGSDEVAARLRTFAPMVGGK
jgi:coenzyme F420-reducing hydrogenase gamma subunit